MNKRYGITELEKELFETIKNLCLEVRKRNGFLEKANGYPSEEIRYSRIVEGLDHLNERLNTRATFISKKEFKERFNIDIGCNGEKILIETGKIRFDLKEETIAFIESNSNKTYPCRVHSSIVSGRQDEVIIKEIKQFLPVSLFKNIRLIDKKINTSVGKIGEWMD